MNIHDIWTYIFRLNLQGEAGRAKDHEGNPEHAKNRARQSLLFGLLIYYTIRYR